MFWGARGQTVVFAIKNANPNLWRLSWSGFVNIEGKDQAPDKSIKFLTNFHNVLYFVNWDFLQHKNKELIKFYKNMLKEFITVKEQELLTITNKFVKKFDFWSFDSKNYETIARHNIGAIFFLFVVVLMFVLSICPTEHCQ